MIVQGKIKIVQSKIQAQTHILMIQSQTLLFSTFPQATQMHKLSPYSPGACTLQYNVPESYTSTSRLEKGLVLHAKVAPMSVIVKANSSLPVVALADSFPLESSFFFPFVLQFLLI